LFYVFLSFSGANTIFLAQAKLTFKQIGPPQGILENGNGTT